MIFISSPCHSTWFLYRWTEPREPTPAAGRDRASTGRDRCFQYQYHCLHPSLPTCRTDSATAEKHNVRK